MRNKQAIKRLAKVGNAVEKALGTKPKGGNFNLPKPKRRRFP